MELVIIIGIIFLGFMLLLIELFLIPGFSFAGMGAFGCFGAGTYLAYQSYGLEGALYAFLISVGLGFTFLILSIKMGMFKRISMKYSEEGEEGYVAGSGNLGDLIGKEGVSVTPLRPAGTASVQNRKVDVVTEGEFIERNARIRVTRIDGNRVIVERA